MKKFAVEVREVHVALKVVEAETMEDAAHLVDRGRGREITIEYSNTLAPETWSVQGWDDDLEMGTGPTFYYNEATGKYDKKIG